MRGAWLLLLLTGWCPAQQGGYTLAGSVVNSRTGEPVKRALVQAFRFVTPEEAAKGAATQPFSATAFTDVSGAFRFTGLAAGTYNLVAQKPHFTEPANTRVPVEIDSSSKEDVRIELSPLGTIEGKITDQRGEPVIGASVIVMQTSISDGRRQTSVHRSVWTDDRGMFRVWDIAPGRYLVRTAGRGGGTYTYLQDTEPSNGGFPGFVPEYFGGATVDSAIPVVIEPGSEARADIGVVLQPTHKVRGRLANFGAGDVTFALISGDEDVATGRINFSRGTGAFEMLEVVNGGYTLRATEGNEATAELPIVVQDTDVNGLRMALAGPVQIPVNVRVLNQPDVKLSQKAGQSVDVQAGQESQEPDPSEAQGFCMVGLTGVGPGSPMTGEDEVNGPVSILPGRHQVLISCSNAYVISAVMGNTDLLANPWISIAPGAAPAPIEVVAHHGGGTITGTIKLDPEPVGRTMFVLAIPRASTRDPELAMVSDEGGREFSFASLAPGEYTLYGLSTDQIEFRNPEFLRGLSGGESVHVEDGATATVTITRLIQ